MTIYANIKKSIPADQMEKVCDRIVQNVSINENGCWIWNGSRFGSGYGKIRINGVQFYAHRVSSELWHVDFDPSLLVCHECPNEHNKACISPWHLKQGTQAYNMANDDTRALISQRVKEALARRA